MLLIPKMFNPPPSTRIYSLTRHRQAAAMQRIIAAIIQRTGARHPTPLSFLSPFDCFLSSLLSGEQERDGSECALLLSGFIFDTIQAISKLSSYYQCHHSKLTSISNYKFKQDVIQVVFSFKLFLFRNI